VSPSSTGGDHVDPEQLRRQERQRDTRDDRREQDEREAGIGRQNPDDELCEIVEDAAPFLHSGFDRGEVVVGQNHVGRFLRDIGAGDAHRHADVGLFERGRVVDTIAGHRDHMPAGLKRAHQP
jgi:hypothetical protein